MFFKIIFPCVPGTQRRYMVCNKQKDKKSKGVVHKVCYGDIWSNCSARKLSCGIRCTGFIFNSKLLLFILMFSFLLLNSGNVQAQKGENTIISTYTEWTTDSQIGSKDTLSIIDTLVVDGSLAFGQGSVLNIYEGAVCIIHGNLDFGTDGIFNLYEDALCIIYGDFNLNNKVNLSIGACLIVGGDLTTNANSNKIETTIDSTAAIYVLGEVDTSQIEGFNCPDPEYYVPYTGSTECNFGDIISLEDNENDSTGIYDFFVSADGNRGVSPVYSELCSGSGATINALEENADWYQWCDSLGNSISGENSYQFITTEPGEYFVKIVLDNTVADTTISYRAKVVGSSLIAAVSENNGPVCIGEDVVFTVWGTDSATVVYNLNGGAELSIILSDTDTTIVVSGATSDQTLNLLSVSKGSASCSLSENSTVTVIAAPFATISNTNGPVCEGDDAEFTLTGTSGATVHYNINGGDNQSVILTDGTALITITGSLEDQILNLVSVVSGSCTQVLSETKTVVVNPLPATGEIIPD